MSEQEAATSVHEQLARMVENGEHATYQALKGLFAELEPTTNEFMFGQWRGGTFDDRAIGNFYGKRFNSEEHCEQILRTKEEVQNGRASCRERGGQYVENPGVDVTLTKK